MSVTRFESDQESNVGQAFLVIRIYTFLYFCLNWVNWLGTHDLISGRELGFEFFWRFGGVMDSGLDFEVVDWND